VAQIQVPPAGTITLHGCGGCGGLWLDNASTSQVVARINPQVVSLAQSASKSAQQRVDLDTSIRCPECGKPLRRIPGGDPSLLIDICEEHGTWFDRDELQQVAALAERRRREQRTAVAAGGAVAAAGVAGVAGVAAMQSGAAQNLASSAGEVAASVGSTAAEVAVEVGIEIVFEGIVSLICGIFD
jgi:Zn-finger nucleic acid-binding protein